MRRGCTVKGDGAHEEKRVRSMARGCPVPGESHLQYGARVCSTTKVTSAVPGEVCSLRKECVQGVL